MFITDLFITDLATTTLPTTELATTDLATTSQASSRSAPTSAGWFDDPRGEHRFRYFDGTDWTDHVTHYGPTPCLRCG